ncbi:MAG: hypothetical protein RR892_01800 [Lachnospiraceae bacterium]
MIKLQQKRTLIIVTGGPGTGKSYAAMQIGKEIEDLVTLSYDTIKEENFDRFGFDDGSQKEELNEFSLHEFYLCLKKQMWLSRTIMIEYPFYQKHKEYFQTLIEEYSYHAITVYLHGDLKIIYDRSVNRDSGDNRHIGHLTNCYHIETTKRDDDFVSDASLNYEQFCEVYEKKNYNIQLGHTISVDITDFSMVDYKQILQRLYEKSMN